MIFLDSSFWIAVVAAGDDHHAEAVGLLGRFGGEVLVTSNHVRGETWTFMRRRYGHRPALVFLDRLARTPRVRLEFVTQALEEEAMRWLRRRDEREYSYVDATSFALMKSLRIRRALAFDGDFSAAGFTELRT